MFKNARLFRLGSPFELEAEALEARLAARAFHPCGPVETATLGWSAPLGEDTAARVHGVGGCLLLCARKQERLLPSAAVAEALEERVAEIETGESREIGRAERRRLKEQIVGEMLPRAFTRSRRTLLYIDTQTGWLVVDTASERQAEDVVSLLRETLGSLPAKPAAPARPASEVLTGWLLDGGAPADFVPADACELRDPREGTGVIRCSGQDLGSDEILNHLRAGKRVVKLALDWDQRLGLVLAEDLSLKRLRLDTALLEEIEDGEDPLARLDAEFAIMALQIRALIARLDALFGLAGATPGTDRSPPSRRPERP
jgi:recombination associated protein RdgC